MKLNIILYYFLFFITVHNILSQTVSSSNDSLIIVNQLYSLVGKEFVVNQSINVDSVENEFSWEYRNINDPYNQLNNCIIFTASERISNSRYGNSIIGILRNNQIIWTSNSIKPSFLSFGRIVTTADLTNSNNTEILTEWSENDQFGTKDLWIFSWDGNSGELITQTQSNGSTIKTHGYSQFDFVDLEGDNIWEIIGYDKSNDSLYLPIVYKWDGTNYSKIINSSLQTIDMFFPRNNFNAILKSTIKEEVNNNLVYKYTIFNNPSSQQSINRFDVYGQVDIIKNIEVPSGWKGYTLNTEISWRDSTNYLGFTYKYKIKPGQILSGFSYETNGLPIIVDAYLRGYNYQWTGDYVNNTSVNDYLNNSVIIKTIAAKLPPNPFIPNEFIDTLISYADSSYALGWIKDEQTRDKYDNYFNNAKNYLNQNYNNAAKAELQKVLTDCNTDSSTVLSSEAYALLYFNTDYLIKQIPEGEPGLPVKLEDSQGNLLQGGSLQ